MRAKLVSRSNDAPQCFVIAKIVKLSLVLSIEIGEEFIAQSFLRGARTFVKIAVDDNFMTVRFQPAEPRHKLLVICEEPLVMIIRHNEQRTHAHTTTGQL